jgi:hypothetical protein
MISFWISVVPPKTAMTGVGSVDSRVRRWFLPFTKKIWPDDQVAVQGGPRQVPRRARVCSGRNDREPFQHWSRYYSQVERSYPWRSDDGAVSLQESRGDPR